MNNVSLLVINMSYDSYISFILQFEKVLQEYKNRFENLGINITHPEVQQYSNKLLDIVTKNFSKEIKVFGSSIGFIKSIVILNYHLGNILLLNKVFNTNSLKVMTFSLQMEDILFIDCFNNFKD